ncbi:YitT family protein [Prolixibacteraceae bacterium]|nr:YitT family protein [Prolixibacteraceae bacterium]
MSFIPKQRLFSRQWFIDYGLILLGCFLMAIGYDYFISPHKIAPGGVYGIAIVLHHVTKGVFDAFPEGLPVGATGLVLNIPLTIAGIWILGPRFGIKTILGFAICSIMIDGITWLRVDGELPLVNDVLLSSIFGGLLIGVGLGLIFKAKATSGGSDIIAMIIQKYSGWSLGKLMIIVDSAIVLIALVAFEDWRIPLYSWLVIYITGKAIDVTMEGMDYNKALIIVSKEYDKIKDHILIDLERGGTMLQGKGMYSDEEKQVIFTVITRREVPILEEHIHRIDPDAFITVMNASEILGEGFQSLTKKVTQD